MEALRQRVIQLEDQLAASGSSSEERPAKRARTTAATSAAPEASGSAPSAAAVKADEKKRKIQVKKIFDRYVVYRFAPSVVRCSNDISGLRRSAKPMVSNSKELQRLSSSMRCSNRASLKLSLAGKVSWFSPDPTISLRALLRSRPSYVLAPPLYVHLVITLQHPLQNASQVSEFFGSEMKGLKGNIWSRGGKRCRPTLLRCFTNGIP